MQRWNMLVWNGRHGRRAGQVGRNNNILTKNFGDSLLDYPEDEPNFYRPPEGSRKNNRSRKSNSSNKKSNSRGKNPPDQSTQNFDIGDVDLSDYEFNENFELVPKAKAADLELANVEFPELPLEENLGDTTFEDILGPMEEGALGLPPIARPLSPQGRRLSAQGRRLSAQGRRLSAQGRRLSAQGRRLSAPRPRLSPRGRVGRVGRVAIGPVRSASRSRSRSRSISAARLPLPPHPMIYRRRGIRRIPLVPAAPVPPALPHPMIYRRRGIRRIPLVPAAPVPPALPRPGLLGELRMRQPGVPSQLYKRLKFTSSKALETNKLRRYRAEIKVNEPTLIVHQSSLPELGRGLFATVNIPKGQALSEYRGYVYQGPEGKAQFDRKYGVEHEFVAPYAIHVRENGDIIDPSQDPNDMKHYTIAQFANDCLGSTSRYMKNIQGSLRPCRVNNARFDEIRGVVFLVADRDIRAGDEIFVNYGPSYWGSPGMRVLKCCTIF